MGLEIVVKSFNGIGDLLFATPGLRRIKEEYPKSTIVVNTNYPQLVSGNPYIDKVGVENEGVFLGYADPIHKKWPTKHHIIEDWEIVCNHYGLKTKVPELRPELWMRIAPKRTDVVGVQVLHKGHWNSKKVWPKFDVLASLDGFQPIPKCSGVMELVRFIASCRAVVCAEGGISHIAKALNVPAIVVFGGFARPDWNGYQDQINLCNEKWCSYCYDPTPCQNEVERLCMKEITIDQILRTVEGLRKIYDLSRHNSMQFVETDALRWCQGKGVDVGGGPCPLRGARNVDDRPDENAYAISEEDGSLDFVFSSHCLEHLDRPKDVLVECLRVLKPGGILYLYFPHPDYIPWRKESMPKWHKHNLYLLDVLSWLEGYEVLEIVQKDFWFGQKIIGRKR